MEYDHIVIGGGTSGAIIASRLSEDSNRSVLLIEAGPYYPESELPEDVRFAFAVSVKDHDWGFKAQAIPGRDMDYARGKVTGGCSAINGTIAVRGLPSDLDEWAKWGNEEWSWEKTLPYYKKFESDQDYGDSYLHGGSGPIPITRWKKEELVPLQQSFLAACLEVGYKWVDDHNDPNSSGVGPMPMNRKGDERVSTSVGYLDPAASRDNLTIRDNTLVNRIVFEGTKAVGVEVVTDGGNEVIRAKQITVSAGAVNSPPILLRSGLGPKVELEALGIEVVADKPGVGKNLIEHSQALVAMIPKEGVTNPSLPDVQLLVDYTAPYSDDFNDMQIYCVNKLGRERFPQLSSDVTGLLFATMVVINRPNSRGSVQITSTDPAAAPKIELNLNTEREDMTRLMDGVRRCWELAHTDHLKELWTDIAVLTKETLDDDDALAQYINDNCGTIWHPVGSNKMGPAGDDTAVVDQYCNVHGVENLKVADASVFPNHVSRNPMLTCMALGERVAEWIQADA
jgi:choline dehydrogenase